MLGMSVLMIDVEIARMIDPREGMLFRERLNEKPGTLSPLISAAASVLHDSSIEVLQSVAEMSKLKPSSNFFSRSTPTPFSSTGVSTVIGREATIISRWLSVIEASVVTIESEILLTEFRL